MSRTVDPFTLVVAQEHDNSGNVRWDGDTTERNKLGNTGLDLGDWRVGSAAGSVMPGILLEHVGLDSTRSDAVGGDTLGATIGSEGSAETLIGGLGGGVQGVVGDGEAGGDGGHEDDATTL